jgi:hypothetical protein
MNIFALDNEPISAAYALADNHVGKMILESTQMLSFVAHMQEWNAPEKYEFVPSYAKHPCTQWLASHPNNIEWLITYVTALAASFRQLHHKNHASFLVFQKLADAFDETHGDFLPSFSGHTKFATAMPAFITWKFDDPVDAYRFYYAYKNIVQFRNGMKWHNGKPDWYDRFHAQVLKPL